MPRASRSPQTWLSAALCRPLFPVAARGVSSCARLHADATCGLQITEMFEAAFPAKAVLGSLEENDEEGDPGDDDVLDSARAEVSGIDERADELDLSKLTI